MSELLEGAHPALNQTGDRLAALCRDLLALDDQLEYGVVHHGLQGVQNLAPARSVTTASRRDFEPKTLSTAVEPSAAR